MNTGQVGAFVAKNKKALMVGGAGVAVAGGLYARSKAPATSDPAAADPAAAGSGAPMPSAGGSGYDSSSSDVYNALQPQIETTQRQLEGTQTLIEKLIEQMKLTPVPPVIPRHKLPEREGMPTPPKRKPPAPPPKKVVPVKVAPKVRPPIRRPPAKAPVKPTQRVYTVRKGDNLTVIAKRLGIKAGWQSLYKANRTVIGSNTNTIKAGQRLVY